MPPSFMRRISFSICSRVTEGPNHHQRIMMRLSSGGVLKACSSAADAPPACLADNAGAPRLPRYGQCGRYQEPSPDTHPGPPFVGSGPILRVTSLF